MYKILVFLFAATTFVRAQEIALTFDDAPTSNGPLYGGPERTTRILSHLKDNGVGQVAFFVVTKNIDAPGLKRLQLYANAGHMLANHTNSHLPIHQLGIQTYIHDIEKADSALRLMKGFAPWFRYPFLDEGKSKPVRDSIRTALQQLGLTNGYVTVDNYDWYINNLLKRALTESKKVNYKKLEEIYLDHIINSIKFYDDIARRALGRSPRHVLLLHENDLAALFLGSLIKRIQANGWKIIAPGEAYHDAIAMQVPDVLFNGQGRVAAIAREKGFQARDLVQPSEDEVYLEELLKTENVFE